MIVDSSAIMAILNGEPEAERFAAAIEGARISRMSAVSYVEAATVFAARFPKGALRFDAFLRDTRIVIEPVSVVQAELAREAYAEYGKGNHKARLNLGDCFAYALSKDLYEPLLFKGEDFTHTDVESALVA